MRDMAQVAEVKVTKDGAVHVGRVAYAVVCCAVIIPGIVQAQTRSAVVPGMIASLNEP